MLALALVRDNRPEEAGPHLLYGLMLAERLDSPGGKARVGLNLARMYDKAGDRAVARAAYQMTLRVAESVGYASIERECRSALERLGSGAAGNE